MSERTPLAESERIDQTWDEIEDLVEQVAQFAKSEISERDFYAELLQRAVRATAAEAGAVWAKSAESIELIVQIGLAKTNLAADSTAQRSHDQFIASVFNSGQQKRNSPRSSQMGGEENPTEFVLMACPVADGPDATTVVVVELFQPPDSSPKAEENCSQLLAVLCEMAGDFHRNQELQQLRGQAGQSSQLEEFIHRIHGCLEIDATAFTICNDGRSLMGCDRVSVVTKRGRKCRTIAISGIDHVDRRSNAVRALEKLAATVLTVGEPLWYSGDTANLAPAIEAALQVHVEQSHAREIAVVPFVEPVAEKHSARLQPQGAVVVERFDVAENEAEHRRRITEVCRHASTAMRNALAHQNTPLMPLMKALQKSSWFIQVRQLPKTVLALVTLMLIVLAAIIVPADFDIEGRGELQPEIHYDIFAPADGVVAELSADHAEYVTSDEVLLVLQRSHLDFEFTRVVGEIQTTQQQLNSVAAKRLNPRSGSSRDETQELAAEEERLKELLKSLQDQRDILRRQQDELQVRSPIDGQVLTWNARERLRRRPVKRGQKLLEVADPAGPWVLKMLVSDNDIGHVNAARKSQADLPVTFLLASHPAAQYKGHVKSIAMTTEANDQREPTVLVTVDFDRELLTDPRPGTTVVAKIHCGRRPIGYVWLHDLYDAVRSRLLF